MSRTTFGVLLLAVPIPLLIVTLSGYAIVRFIVSAILQTGAGGVEMFIGQAMTLLLSIIGVVAMLGIVIGMPIGAILIILGNKKKTAS